MRTVVYEQATETERGRFNTDKEAIRHIMEQYGLPKVSNQGVWQDYEVFELVESLLEHGVQLWDEVKTKAAH